jgi:hypothetical protein
MNPMIIFILLTLWLLTELKDFFLNGGASNKLAFVLLKIIFIFIMMVVCFFFNFFMRFFQNYPAFNLDGTVAEAYSMIRNKLGPQVKAGEPNYLNNFNKENLNKGYNSH